MTALAERPPRVLVVDDDHATRLIAKTVMERDGAEVDDVGDGPSALARCADEAPDLVVLDIGMPGMSGLEVMSRLRRTHETTPVILLTTHGAEADRVLGLELGADDYMVKPFSPRELAARARSVLRRSRATNLEPRIEVGPLVVDVARRRVRLDGRVVELTAKEFDLLAFLAASPPGRVYSRAELLREVWASSAEWQDPATVTEHVRRLRKKIERDPEHPQWIETVRGVGYRFEPQPPGDQPTEGPAGA